MTQLTDDLIQMQQLVNSGEAWKLEGSYGRSAMSAMEAGLLMLGRDGHRDYWGNYVPARSQVKPGTKGSYGYVADLSGEEYAAALAEIPG